MLISDFMMSDLFLCGRKMRCKSFLCKDEKILSFIPSSMIERANIEPKSDMQKSDIKKSNISDLF